MNILTDYINDYEYKYVTYEDSEKLRAKLSLPDSIINKKAVYDYLVDLFVKHESDSKNRLSSVVGYHWDYGVEFVKVKYDKSDRLIYFLHQSIGSIRREFFFKYDKSGRVSIVEDHYSSVGANPESKHYTDPEISFMKFTYDSSGIMNSQSFMQTDGKWLTRFFKIK
jgi:hypothetical protein